MNIDEASLVEALEALEAQHSVNPPTALPAHKQVEVFSASEASSCTSDSGSFNAPPSPALQSRQRETVEAQDSFSLPSQALHATQRVQEDELSILPPRDTFSSAFHAPQGEHVEEQENVLNDILPPHFIPEHLRSQDAEVEAWFYTAPS